MWRRCGSLYFLLRTIRAERVGGAELLRAWGIVIKCIAERDAGKAPLEARVWEPVRDMLSEGKLGDDVKGGLADALARYLGPVHKLWEGGRGEAFCWSEGFSTGATVSACSSCGQG
jgi:hypothetical protein